MSSESATLDNGTAKPLNKVMAESEDIRARVRKINPKALEIMDEFDRQLAKLGGRRGVMVTTTEDMTPEEEEMAVFEGYLKEGYAEDIAAHKAKEFLALMNQSLEIMRRRRSAK
jgi:predicted GTPase